MNNFNIITQKLERFIKKYYANKLIKGAILFFTIGLLYFILTLFVEYVLWLNTTIRTILFWLFVAFEIALFINYIIIPLLGLFKLRKGINYEYASQIIGNHFPKVNDKLFNILQLKQSKADTDLLIASIEQKSKELEPIPFKSAINFKANTKYLKYAAIPIFIIFISFLTGKIQWFNEGYERIVNYEIAYQPPAPFEFFVLNESLKTLENTSFKLKVSTIGTAIPENVQIKFNQQKYFLQQITPGEFEFEFSLPKTDIEFQLTANQIDSKPYILNVVKTPNLVNFEMTLQYPKYVKKQNETLKGTGSAVVPEGTKIIWNAQTKSTSQLNIYANDTLNFKQTKSNNFEASKHLFKNYHYAISTSNNNLKDYENLAYSIQVIKDQYPQLNINVKKDSLDQQSLYFHGQVSDDYGLSKLLLVYYESDNESTKKSHPIPISKSNFSEFISAFPNQFNLKEGVSYELYFEVFDNDKIHNYKKTKSATFSYRKLTKSEEENKQLNSQNETIKSIDNSFKKLKDQDKKLEQFSKLQKEKKQFKF